MENLLFLGVPILNHIRVFRNCLSFFVFSGSCDKNKAERNKKCNQEKVFAQTNSE